MIFFFTQGMCVARDQAGVKGHGRNKLICVSGQGEDPVKLKPKTVKEKKQKKGTSSCYDDLESDISTQHIYFFNDRLYTLSCFDATYDALTPTVTVKPFPVVENQYSYIIELPDITVRSYQIMYNIDFFSKSSFTKKSCAFFPVVVFIRNTHTRPKTHTAGRKETIKSLFSSSPPVFATIFTQKMHNPCIQLRLIGNESH